MIGQLISHYKILEKLGEGGMGVVYKAHDGKLDRDVALKFLPAAFASSSEDIARFELEAKAISALNHPNIATIFDIDEADGKKFLVLEFLPGGTLKSKLKKLKAEDKEFPIPEVIDYGIQMAEGLAHAHRHQIVHRDIKSDNMTLTEEGKVKITDFGLAKLRGTAHLTRTGSTIGTLAYMAPEQLRGEDIDHRADLFSFGVVLYEMVTSRMPFRGEHEAALTYSIANEDPAPVKSLRQNLPTMLEQVITKCLQKDRALRYQSADDIVADLRTLQHETAGKVKTVVVKQHSKLPWVIGAAIVALAAVGIFVFAPSTHVSSTNSKTIAVLPFSNMSGNPDDEYFSDGITEDILTQLAKINDLKVISRTTMMQFKGTKKSLKEIGTELNAGVVLEGSVRRVADQVRITAQLIDAGADEHLWAETYDKEFKQIFAIQSDVAQKIAAALEAKLSPTEKERIEKKPTAEIDAYNFYLRGRYYWNQRSSTTMPTALRFFQDAVAIDPQYALAWTGIADCYSVASGYYFGISPQEALAKSKAAAQKAIVIDSSLAEVHASLAAVQNGLWDWQAAERSFRRAIELNPGYATAHQWYGELLYTTGRIDEAMVEVKRSLELDPLSLIINSQVAWLYLAARDADRALVESRRTLSMEPTFFDALECQAQALVLGRRPESAIFPAQLKNDSVAIPLDGKECQSLRDAFHRDGLKGYWNRRLIIVLDRANHGTLWWQGFLAESYAQIGESQKAIDYIQRMYEQKDPLMTLIKIWVYFDPLRSETRFQSIVRKMNFPK